MMPVKKLAVAAATKGGQIVAAAAQQKEHCSPSAFSLLKKKPERDLFQFVYVRVTDFITKVDLICFGTR